MSFTLRFPFEASPGREISGIDQDFEFGILGYPAILSRSGNRYIIKVSSIPSENLAEELVPKLWSGLAWLLVQRDIGFSAKLELDHISYADDPHNAGENLARSLGLSESEPIDGLSTGGDPSIYLSDKHIRFIDIGNVTVTVSTQIDIVSEMIMEGTSARNATEIPSDPRLRTALDLYSSHFNEFSGNARLLTLTMVLETLTVPIRKPEIALKLLEKWNEELESIIKSTSEGSLDYEGLDSLQRELIFRRDLSIRSQLRGMVQNTLEKVGYSDASSKAKDAIDAYDVRSKLIHKGSIPASELSVAHTKARQVAKLVLEAQFEGVLRSWELGA